MVDASVLLHTTVNGRYRLNALLGPAGSGLFEADVVEHRKIVGRCAFRLWQWNPDPGLPPFLPDAEAWREFKHPAVQAPWQVGEVWSGPATGAMFLVSDLATPLVGTEDPAQVMGVLAGVLQDLHARDLVHGRVKPGNVLSTAAGFKLADLGLVPSRAREVLAHVVHQQSVDWLAPELLQGELGPAADMWGLGATSLWLLERRAPAEGTVEARLEASMAPRPRLWAALPGPWDLIIPGCLQPNPERRWTADRVRAALEHRLHVPEPLPATAGVPRSAEANLVVEARVRALCWSASGHHLVAGLQDGTVQCWVEEEPAWQLRRPGPVVAIRTRVERLVVDFRSGRYLILDAEAGTVLEEGEQPAEGAGGRRVAVSADGTVATGGVDGTVSLLRPGQSTIRPVVHGGPVTGLAWTAAGLATCSWDGSVALVAQDGSAHRLLGPSSAPLAALAAAPQWMAAGGPAGPTWIWDLSQPMQPVACLRDLQPVALALAHRPARMAVANRRGQISIRPAPAGL